MSSTAASSASAAVIARAAATHDTATHLTPLFGYRLVSLGLLISLIWKLKTFRWMLIVYQNIPLSDPFFPAWLQADETLVFAYVLAALLALWGIVSSSPALLRFQTSGLCLALAVLCVHQGSYNDVTFCTAFWTAVWCWWYVRRIEHDAPELLHDKAATLGHLVIAVILLGGAVGKMTPGYWNGQVLFEIYFLERDFWTFNTLRAMFDPEQLRQIATWYSRFVVVAELSGAVLVMLLPRRWASVAAIAILVGISLLSNLSLVSVLACLVGLAAFGLLPARFTEGRSIDVHLTRISNEREDGHNVAAADQYPALTRSV